MDLLFGERKVTKISHHPCVRPFDDELLSNIWKQQTATHSFISVYHIDIFGHICDFIQHFAMLQTNFEYGAFEVIICSYNAEIDMIVDVCN